MSVVFADTAFFIALFNPADRFHGKSVIAADKTDQRTVTSEWILMEVADGFSRTRFRAAIKPLCLRLHASSMTEVVPVSSVAIEEALDLYDQHGDKGWTLTDCTSFLIMRERGLTEALTGDHHFEQAGFIALLK